jgi:hypothetical protein
MFYGANLAVVYDSVLFPFEVLAFLRSLSKRAYLVPDPIAADILAPPHGARVETGKLVARKADILLALDTDRKTMIVSAPVPPTAADEMEDLEALLRDELGIDATQFARFYELSCSLTATGTTNPLQSWAASLQQVPMLSRIPAIVGTEITPFGLRFVGKDQTPTQSEWLDIRIEPRVLAPTTHHYADVVFRHPDRTRVLQFARNLERTVQALIALLEEQ